MSETQQVTLPHTGLHVPDTRLAVTALTRKASGYTATLRLGKAIVGHIYGSEHGSCTFIPQQGAGFGYDELNAYAFQCRTALGTSHTGSVLNALVDEFEIHRLLAKHTKSGTAFRLLDTDGMPVLFGCHPAALQDSGVLTLADYAASKAAQLGDGHTAQQWDTAAKQWVNLA